MARPHDTPPDGLGPTSLRLLALLVLRQCSVHDLAAACQITRGAVYLHLRRLRKFGLVDFDSHKNGTIRATCQLVPAGQL
jgi:DNA-binding transcriptional ArsR family regulator